jgi:hypothetical protein
MAKKILIALVIILVAIQFIRPKRNVSNAPDPNDIANVYPVPTNVDSILKPACMDCHSNHTRYPWYTNIQPVGWWLQNHINDGKKELNFSEFGAYPKKKQAHKLKEVAEQVQKGHMPLDSYLWIHKDGVLDQQHKDILINWATNLQHQIEQQQ